mgnify:CR=1 FL=1
MTSSPPTVSQVRRVAALDDLEVLRTRLVGHSFPQHVHDTYVVQLVRSGRDHCPVSGATARRDELFVHGPQVSHGGESGPDEPLRYEACYPSPRLMDDVLGLAPGEAPAVGTRVLGGPTVARVAAALFNDLGHASLATQRARLRDVLELVVEDASSEQDHADTLAEPLRRARDHLRRHVARDVTTHELSGVCGLSPSHLIRAFKRAFRITPRQYLISQRVAAARHLLAAGRPIADVAHELGFADQSHLTRQCKRLTTLSPGQLRRA